MGLLWLLPVAGVFLAGTHVSLQFYLDRGTAFPELPSASCGVLLLCWAHKDCGSALQALRLMEAEVAGPAAHQMQLCSCLALQKMHGKEGAKGSPLLTTQLPLLVA